VLTLGL